MIFPALRFPCVEPEHPHRSLVVIVPRLTEYRTDTGSHRLTTEDWGVGQETEEIHASNDGEGGGPRRVTPSEARRGEERRGEAQRLEE